MNDLAENNGVNPLEDNAFNEAQWIELYNKAGLKSIRVKDFTSATSKFICLYGILVLVLIDLVLITLENDTKQVLSITENWSRKPIEEIIVANMTCPPEYENIINGQFLGTHHGCNCARGYSSSGLIFKDSCSQNDEDNCDDIYSIDPVKLDNIKGLVICAKRAGPDFTSLNLPFTNCSNGFKPCGSQHDYFVCMPIGQECPITDINIVPLSAETPSNYSAISFDTSHKLIFTRDSFHHHRRFPIVDFKFEEGQPCIDPREHPSPMDAEWYVLDRRYQCTVEIEGETRNPRYHEFFSVSDYELYAYINLTDLLLRELPDYDVEKFKKYQRSLYWASWVPWNFECERQTGITREHIVKHIDKVRAIADSQSDIYYIALCGYLIVAALNIYVWVKRAITRWTKLLKKARQILSTVFGILELIELITIILNTRAIGAYLQTLQAAAHCSDSIANYSLSHITQSLKYNQWVDLLAVFVVVFVLAIEGGALYILLSTNKIKRD